MQGMPSAIRLSAAVILAAAGTSACGPDSGGAVPPAASTPTASAAPHRPLHADQVSLPAPPRAVVQSPTGPGPVRVACATCHDVRPSDPAQRGATLEAFHTDLVIRHGDLACLACHHPDDADVLRRADGTRLRYEDSMALCAQCHARQARDWTDGLHGGMSGHWDRTVGPRRRHHCLVCHDPHAPAFPAMRPTFKPRDRFLGGGEEVHP